MMLKLSVAVHPSLAEILICQLCVHDFWHCHGDLNFICSFDQISFDRIKKSFDRILYFSSFLKNLQNSYNFTSYKGFPFILY